MLIKTTDIKHKPISPTSASSVSITLAPVHQRQKLTELEALLRFEKRSTELTPKAHRPFDRAHAEVSEACRKEFSLNEATLYFSGWRKNIHPRIS